MALSNTPIFWHQDLIHHLRSSILRKLHKDCCEARDCQWATYDSYIFNHPYSWLFYYHRYVLIEMSARKLKWKLDWSIENFRGKMLYSDPNDPFVATDFKLRCSKKEFSDKATKFWSNSNKWPESPMRIYPEHNDSMLSSHIQKLISLNEKLINGKSISEIRMNLAVKGISI